MAAHPGAARAVRRPVNCLAMTRHRLPLRLALLGVLVMMLRCGMSSAALSSSSVCSSKVLPCTRTGSCCAYRPWGYEADSREAARSVLGGRDEDVLIFTTDILAGMPPASVVVLNWQATVDHHRHRRRPARILPEFALLVTRPHDRLHHAEFVRRRDQRVYGHNIGGDQRSESQQRCGRRTRLEGLVGRWSRSRVDVERRRVLLWVLDDDEFIHSNPKSLRGRNGVVGSFLRGPGQYDGGNAVRFVHCRGVRADPGGPMVSCVELHRI